MTPILVFDIETIPDVAGIRRLHGLPDDLPEAEVAEVAFQIRRTKTGSDFLPPPQHREVVVSCVLRNDEGVQVFSIGEPERREPEILQKFWDGVEKLVPQLVAWNGGGFDLPVMSYRSLVHGVTAPMFWETGDENRDFRYNNYVSRYHSRHQKKRKLLSLFLNQKPILSSLQHMKHIQKDLKRQAMNNKSI